MPKSIVTYYKKKGKTTKEAEAIASKIANKQKSAKKKSKSNESSKY